MQSVESLFIRLMNTNIWIWAPPPAAINDIPVAMEKKNKLHVHLMITHFPKRQVKGFRNLLFFIYSGERLVFEIL